MTGVQTCALPIFNEVTNSKIDNLPTCGVLEIHFNAESWKKTFDDFGKMHSHVFPKEIIS